MPQFDILTMGSQIFSVLFFFISLYFFHIQNTIPSVIEVKKFRKKKLLENKKKAIVIKNNLNSSLKYTGYFYQSFLLETF